MKLGLCVREQEGGSGGWCLWFPAVMLCKALLALPPAVIPLWVSLTLGNWAVKGQEHGSSGVLPPVLGCRRGACCRAEAVGWAGCAGPVLGLPKSVNAMSTMEKLLLAAELGQLCKMWEPLSSREQVLYA